MAHFQETIGEDDTFHEHKFREKLVLIYQSYEADLGYTAIQQRSNMAEK